MGKNKPPQSKPQETEKSAPSAAGRRAERVSAAPPKSATPPQGTGAPSGSGAPAAGGAGIFNHPAPEGHAKTMSAVLGEIVWLMSQSPLHKQFFISDLEWFVMTPVMLQQFRIYYAADRPIGVVFWGFVSEEVEERLKQGVTKQQSHDWKSGERLWIVEVINPSARPGPRSRGRRRGNDQGREGEGVWGAGSRLLKSFLARRLGAKIDDFRFWDRFPRAQSLISG